MARRTGTQWCSPWHGEDFDLLPDGAEMPREVVDRGPVSAAIILSGLALAALVTAAYLFTHPGGGDPFQRIVGPAALGAVALGLLVVCWFLMRSSKLRITPDEIRFTPLDGVRTAGWQEPTSAYRGVLRSAKVTQEDEGSTVRHVLVLQHSTDLRKNVVLYSSTAEQGLLERQKRYAHLFSLPALIETEDGVERVAPEDLDKPLPVRAREGVHGTIPPAGPPPQDLAITIEGNTVTMRTRRRPSRAAVAIGTVIAAVGALFFIDACADLGRFGRVGEPDVILGALAGLLAFAAGVAIATVRMVFVQVLRASPDRIESWHEVGAWKLGRLSIRARDVREVNVEPHSIHPLPRALGLRGDIGDIPSGPAVIIPGGSTTIAFGHVLSKESRRWVRDCVLSVLGAGGLRG